MQRIETLQLRAFRSSDLQAAIEAFHQLTFQAPEDGLGDVRLLHASTRDNDLCIVLRWRDGAAPGKSTLGLRLAAAFSEFGRIDHSVWQYADKPARRSYER